MNNNNNLRNPENGRVIAGLLLVTAGSFLLLRELGFFFPGWLFSWPMILIMAGIYTGAKNSFKNNSWIIMIAIGGFFLLNKILPDLHAAPFFWPSLIIVAGILFIVRPRFGDQFKRNDYDTGRLEMGNSGEEGTSVEVSSPDNSDFLRIHSIFSGVNRTVLSKNFQGGTISCVFGGSEINFSQADITGPVTIKADIIFGGVKLIVPPHWAVQNQIDGIFHGVDDKRRINMVSDMNPSKVIILKGSVIFGGIEIKNPR